MKEWLQPEIDEATQIGIQQGMQQGLQQGMQQGLQQGLQLGVEQARSEIVKKSLASGNRIEQIADFMGLSVDEVRKLSEM